MSSTPLYKRLKDKGTTFIAFPGSSNDFNVYSFQDQYEMQVSKFVLLNIPSSSGSTLNLSKTTVLQPDNGINVYNFDPNNSYPTKYSEQLVESLRNYVANQDVCFRESRLSVNKDYYNPMERKNPTEMIFWKWARLNNIIDFEPAEHKIDWDKNLSDFDNPNASTTTHPDYFRKYLWKEREVRDYNCVVSKVGSYPEVIINSYSKFKIGDEILFKSTYVNGISGSTVPSELGSSTHKITDIIVGTEQTTLTLEGTYYSEVNDWTGVCYLNYHKLVQYIGDIQYNSKVRSSQQTFTEFAAAIPAHAGQSPSVLFETTRNTNYYPGLQLPILDEQIQDEIIGSENLSSPIRTNPNDYPGSYYGYFDTYDKTYKTSTGDAIRYSGEYYGILKNNNYGTSNDDYFEQLEDFNSNNIDGVSIDFNINHYYKSKQAGSTVTTFDEFNTISINDNPPADFEFNAILWYYSIHDTSDTTNSYSSVYTNLYGIEFLDNPDNDFGEYNDRIITPTKKLVTNTYQDGYSYIYNLNLDFKVDNDMLPLRYDPTSIYNAFGFDIYNKVMSNYVLLTDQFRTIIGEFIKMNTEIVKLKSLLYSQTDINDIKNRLNNQENLLKMYKTNQFVDSSTVKISIDYTKNYPALSFNAVNVDYNEIYTMYTTEIANYNLSMSGQTSTYSEKIVVPPAGKFMVNILNDMVIERKGLVLSVTLDRDLDFKQSVDFLIRPDISLYTNEMNINVMFYDGTPNPKVEKNIISLIDTPTDVLSYKYTDPTGSTFNNAYYMDLSTFIDRFTTGTTTNDLATHPSGSWTDNYDYINMTTIDLKENLFYAGDYVYIESLYLQSGGTDSKIFLDYSGLYKILYIVGIQAVLDLDLSGKEIHLRGTPKVHYYKGMKINVLRVDESNTSDVTHRYLVTKDFITEKTQKIH